MPAVPPTPPAFRSISFTVLGAGGGDGIEAGGAERDIHISRGTYTVRALARVYTSRGIFSYEIYSVHQLWGLRDTPRVGFERGTGEADGECSGNPYRSRMAPLLGELSRENRDLATQTATGVKGTSYSLLQHLSPPHSRIFQTLEFIPLSLSSTFFFLAAVQYEIFSI